MSVVAIRCKKNLQKKNRDINWSHLSALLLCFEKTNEDYEARHCEKRGKMFLEVALCQLPEYHFMLYSYWSVCKCVIAAVTVWDFVLQF